MKDFLGQELQLGDDIVVAVAHGSNAGASLVQGKIRRFGKDTVYYVGGDYAGYDVKERRVTPRKVARVPNIAP